MSKCIELFNEWVCGKQPTCKEIWQAAWNARGEADAEICRNSMHVEEAQIAIEQEQCK